MVIIKSSYVVIPSEPTPNGKLWLSECDQIAQWTHAPIIFIYKPNITITSPFETMRNSLSRALVHYYPLAGRLHWTQGGRLELDCNAKGAQVLEAYSEQQLDDLGDFAPTDAVQDLVPKVDYTTPIEEWPLLLLQLTRFRCGGLCVGLATSHIMADGWAATNFTNSWAKLARGDVLGDDDEMPFFDRTLLRSCEPLKAPRFDHIEFKEPPLLVGCLDSKAERKKKTSVTLLKVTREQVQGLKNRANNEFSNEKLVASRPYSSYEAIASYMWRCVCKARAGDECQPTRARIMVSIKNRFKPPLPQGYFGNAILPTVTSTCLYGDLISKPLSYVAGKMREAIERMTDEYVVSSLDFVTSQKDMAWLRTNLHIQGNMEGPFLGNPNFSSNSWMKLPIYGADFGWGKPDYVGPGLLGTDGNSFIMPNPTSDGSLTIVLRLQTQYMDSFKKFFYEDMDSKKPFIMSAKS